MKQEVEVLALHKKDGKIIPVRVRMIDENGEPQEFKIKQYKDVSGLGARAMPDGMHICDSLCAYECYIEVNGMRRLIRLYYHPDARNGHWTMTDIGE